MGAHTGHTTSTVKAADTANTGRAATAATAADTVPIVLYSADGCIFCDEAKAFLKDRGLAYEERNVNRSIQYLREARDLGNRWLPIVKLGDDTVLVSPSVEELWKALEKALCSM